MISKGKPWRFLFDSKKYGVEPMYIIATSAVNIVLVWLPYEMLVEGGILISVIPAILLLGVFVYFKWKRPFMKRPYEVRGGVLVACLLILFPFVINLAYILLSIMDNTPVMGVRYINLFILTTVLGGGLIFEQLYLSWLAARPRVTMLQKEEADMLMGPLSEVKSTRDSYSGHQGSNGSKPSKFL